MITNERPRWIWYAGDFEIRQGLLQNFSREERGYDWPAYWYIDDCHKNENLNVNMNYKVPRHLLYMQQGLAL